MTDIVTHEKDDLLRECMLTDSGLMMAEMGHPGSVRVLSSGRYHARLSVDGEGYEFSITETGLDEFGLVSNYPDDPQDLLYDLVWHRAAEAILAHRKGHFEAKRNKLLRKAQRQEA
jgi:hypothetical protein